MDNLKVLTKNRYSQKLRVATLNYLPSAFKLCTNWIHENGHEHVLAVTSPGIKTRATPGYKDVLPIIPSHVNMVCTSRIKSILTPILHHFQPDIILCFTFAHLLDSSICEIPTFGAVNIHPSVLPAYRGPNPLRQFYDGAKQFGATAHRIKDGYDTGEILSCESAPLPELVTKDTAVKWAELIKRCIANGMEMAISGHQGIPQDDRQATYGGPFAEDEKWVLLSESTKCVLRKTLALNLAGGLAKAQIDGQLYKIHSAEPLFNQGTKPAGKLMKYENGVFEIATSDGAVKLIAEPYDSERKYCNVLPEELLFANQIQSLITH
jgi:methionyl-tRNA formyltransferase